MSRNEGPILLVEDNPDDVVLTLAALEENRIPNPVIVAGDGEEALEYLFREGRHAGREAHIMPQVVFLDLHLPGIDGMEVLRRIRTDERTASLPVILLTSSDEESDVTRGYRLGANSYVRKPVDFDRFMEVAKQLGCYWLTLNEWRPTA